jgi:hypothetical protein
MPSQDRDVSSRDRELVRHQGSHTDSGRLSVPMYVIHLIILPTKYLP